MSDTNVPRAEHLKSKLYFSGGQAGHGADLDRSGKGNGGLRLSQSPQGPQPATIKSLRPDSGEVRGPRDASSRAAVSASILLPKKSTQLNPTQTGPQSLRPHEPSLLSGRAGYLQVPCGNDSGVIGTRRLSVDGPVTKEVTDYHDRSKQWYKHLLHYRTNPDTLEFSYMVLADPNGIIYHPYDLLVVPHSKVQRDFYYTMSSEGVTQFNGKETSHASLDEFERSFFLYQQVSQMQFFFRFRLWKAFRLWRAFICRHKSHVAGQFLVKRLFHLDGCFGPCLQALVRTCDTLQTLTSFTMLAADQPLRLGDLQAFFLAAADSVLARLERFKCEVVQHVHGACSDALADLDEVLFGIRDGIMADEVADTSSASSVGASRARKQSRPNFAQSVRTVQSPLTRDEELTYAMSAARRTEKRRIVSFVRLCDSIIASAMRVMLDQAAQNGLSLVTSKTFGTKAGKYSARPHDNVSGNAVPAPLQDRSTPSRLSAVPPGSSANADPLVLFAVNLLVSGSENGQLELQMEPGPDEILESVHCQIQAVQDLAAEGMPQLSRHADLEKFLHVDDDTQWIRDEPTPAMLREMVVGTRFTACTHDMLAALGAALDDVEAFRCSLQPYLDMLKEMRGISVGKLEQRFQAGDIDLDGIRQLLQTLARYKEQISELQVSTNINVVAVTTESLQQALAPEPARCIAAVHTLVPKLAGEMYDTFMSTVTTATTKLTQKAESVADAVHHVHYMAVCESDRGQMDQQYERVEEYYNLCKEFEMQLSPEDSAKISTLHEDYRALQDAMWSAESNKEQLCLSWKEDLDAQVADVRKQVLDIRVQAQHDMLLDPATDMHEASTFVAALAAQLNEVRAEAAMLEGYRRELGFEKVGIDELDDVIVEIELKELLWTSWSALHESCAVWNAAEFFEVDAAEIERKASTHERTCHKLASGLIPNSIVPAFHALVHEWSGIAALASALQRSEVKQRHWTRIEDLLAVSVPRNAELTIAAACELDMLRHKDGILAIVSESTQEAALEDMLRGVEAKWATAEFEFRRHKNQKDTYLLDGFDDVIALLEECNVSLMAAAASRFAAGVQSTLDSLSASMRLLSETLDVWMELQRMWMYLEPIFAAPDIQRQLPDESQQFTAIDRSFRAQVLAIRERPNVMQAFASASLLQACKQKNEALEQILARLEAYLERKRVAFPRLYFLSNDELLGILSQANDPRAVQSHLSKLFDGVAWLDMEGEGRSLDVHAMNSAEGERVALFKSLKARGAVEVWLANFESAMHGTLKKIASAGLKSYLELPQCEWVLQQPAQLALTVSQVFWCQNVSAALAGSATHNELRALRAEAICKLEELTGLAGKQLTALQRRSVVALITIRVHNRDVVSRLIADQCESADDFAWRMQLRHNSDADDVCITIAQADAQFEYGYEYHGAQPRLVITPMTERCYLTLTSALTLHLGAAPQGPAGTGKTETIKDLGKTVGTQTVVFNCGEKIDNLFMARFLAGLAQCGAWACFDEFNRIDVEVLSVVAQQLAVIQNGLKTGVSEIVFEGRSIKLLPSCAVFVTMNPGYAGRTTMPDNLDALFRPIAMMVPDYVMVCEVILFSEGFCTAPELSRKVVRLFELASQQLSKQRHYDFGMRALKAVLTIAGDLARAHLQHSEDELLVKAVCDTNSPKLLADDLELFQGIVQDLFPHLDKPVRSQDQLTALVEEAAVELHLQAVPTLTHKCLQLHDTMSSRFGVMLVGNAGGGKSSIRKTLAAAHDKMATTDESGRGHPTEVRELNPKVFSLGQLYGQYSQVTGDWKDGLASAICRQASEACTAARQWVVFDGPVDPLWIESLNTVLDDNCMLCLPNGERMKLDSGKMHVLFETDDLDSASPATVSRCGMVYVPQAALAWQPLVQQALDNLPDNLGLDTVVAQSADAVNRASVSEQLLVDLRVLADTYLPQGMTWLQTQGCEDIASTTTQRIKAWQMWLQALLHSEGAWVHSAPYGPAEKAALSYVFAFSFVWGLGGNLSGGCRNVWDQFVRELFNGVANFPPGSGTVYDFCCDPERNFAFKTWKEAVPGFTYDTHQPFGELFVPTTSSVRCSWFIDAAQARHDGLLLVGPSGCGKTAIVLQSLQHAQDVGATDIIRLTLSAGTSSETAQDLIQGRLEKKTRTCWGAAREKRLALFVDDLNMPRLEQFGAQPVLELLRTLQDCGGFYDRNKLSWNRIEDVAVVAACCPPGGGRQPVSARITRHLAPIHLTDAPEIDLRAIGEGIIGGFLSSKFAPETAFGLIKPIVMSTVEVYNMAAQNLLPTPSKMHYNFGLRDVCRVFQGFVDVNAASCGLDPTPTLAKLWLHESMRVFHDRLTESTDQTLIKESVHGLLNSRFGCCDTYASIFEEGLPVLFADCNRIGLTAQERKYEQVTDSERLVKSLEYFLASVDTVAGPPPKIVFFDGAIEHVLRLARILRQPCGNALLLGLGGSGKQTLARLAACVAGCKLSLAQRGRGTGHSEFREVLRSAYESAGIDGTKICLLLTDGDLPGLKYLEDMCSVVSTGHVPNLFSADECEVLFSRLRTTFSATGASGSREAMYQAFLRRVRSQLHVVFCMSPAGTRFRDTCRQYPALVNNCTIDWYEPWSQAGLLAVAKRVLAPEQEAPSTDLQAVMHAMPRVHAAVTRMGGTYEAGEGRIVYVTPQAYLDHLALFSKLLSSKRESLTRERARVTGGLKRMRDTETLVAEMEQELHALGPVLHEKTSVTAALLKDVSSEQEDAEQMRVAIAGEEAEIKKSTLETEVMRNDACSELEEVLPALHAAADALNALNKNDIVEIKTFTKPPNLVQLTLEGVCGLLGEKADWDSARRVLSDANFLKRLVEYDRDTITDGMLRQIARVIGDPNFTPDAVAKQSKAAQSMCLWVRAMHTYAKVAQLVAPKRARLHEAEEVLGMMNSHLQAKQVQLQNSEDALAALTQQLQDTQAELKRLEDQAELSKRRLASAGVLLASLAGEAGRWESTSSELDEDLTFVVGNALVASACVSHMGPFSESYRTRLLAEWLECCQDVELPISQDFSLQHVLSSAMEARSWWLQGLPSDKTSTDSAVLVTQSHRWPLLIDPQQQGEGWLMCKEAHEGMQTLRTSDPGFLKRLEQSIALGTSVLVQDVPEVLDTSLEPLLRRNVQTKSGRQVVQLGDVDVDYNSSFQLYLATRLSNPHLMPEIFIQTSVINFVATSAGLQEQLLADTVRHEKPSVERDRDDLVVSLAKSRQQLTELEDKMLSLLSESEGNILDDEELISTLDSSRVTSAAIKQRVAAAEATEVSLDAARAKFAALPRRASILYFETCNLSRLSPMYQYSLASFKQLFSACLDSAEQASHPEGLFKQHRMPFMLSIAAAVAHDAGSVSLTETSYLLRGTASNAAAAGQPNPLPAVLPDASWQALQNLAAHAPRLEPLVSSAASQADFWRDYVSAANPWTLGRESEGAGGLRTIWSAFDHMLVAKCCAPQHVSASAEAFVVETVGHNAFEQPQTGCEDAYAASSAISPVLHMSEAGVDPTGTIIHFAASKGLHVGERLHVISMGRGQGHIADDAVQQASVAGDWVLLQNCHLAADWLPALAAHVQGFAGRTDVHHEFRLWLTSAPTPAFPIAVLRACVKVAVELPAGLRESVQTSLAELPDDVQEVLDEAHTEWRALAYATILFHGVAQERRTYGPAGWSVPYKFAHTDLVCSLRTTLKLVRRSSDAEEHSSENGLVPWSAITHILGQIHYGGRVTDGHDRLVLDALVKQHIAPTAFKGGTPIGRSSDVAMPMSCASMQCIRDHARGLPDHGRPEVLSLHTHAAYQRDLRLGMALLGTALRLQPHAVDGVVSSSGRSQQDWCTDALKRADEILQSLPALLDLRKASQLTCRRAQAHNPFATLTTGAADPLGSVLRQEVFAYSRLRNTVVHSLESLKRAVQGLEALSADLEQMLGSILNNEVPHLWQAVSYLSEGSLDTWLLGFGERMHFMGEWLYNGVPKVMWLPGLFDPLALVTALQQRHARQHSVAIDSLTFDVIVTGHDTAETVNEAAVAGHYIAGLTLDSARWDKERQCLCEANVPGSQASLPVLHLLPCADVPAGSATYKCPLYRTAARAGALTTTGHSTNFVMHLDLPIAAGTTSTDWLLQGAAALCCTSI